MTVRCAGSRGSRSEPRTVGARRRRDPPRRRRRSGVVLRLPRVPGRPHVAAGRHLAPAGYYFEAVHDPVEAADLVGVALRELAAGARWVKLVADFASAAARASSASPVNEPTYDLDVVRELVAATHGVEPGSPPMSRPGWVADLVALGIDSIDTAPRWTKTRSPRWLAVAPRGRRPSAPRCRPSADAPEERQQLVAERRERFRALLPMAVRLGVPVLTGSDVVGSVPRRDRAPRRLRALSDRRAPRGNHHGRRFLGADAAGAPPAVVTYEEDPRDDPRRADRRPAAVVIGGVRVR